MWRRCKAGFSDSPLCFEGVVAVDGLVDWCWVGGVGNRGRLDALSDPVQGHTLPPLPLSDKPLTFIASPYTGIITAKHRPASMSTRMYRCQKPRLDHRSHGQAVTVTPYVDNAHFPFDALRPLLPVLKTRPDFPALSRHLPPAFVSTALDI